MMDSLNWLAIIVASIANLVIGGVWYGPLFGKVWMKLNNFTEEEMKGISPGPLYAQSFAATVVCYAVLASVISIGNNQDAVQGIKWAGVVWLGFVATVQFTAHLFSKKPFNAFLLDTGYQFVTFVAAGAILGAWQ
jgi:hypothetical protein